MGTVDPYFLSAVSFAAEKHKAQHRKDGITPYINHPLAVAHLLSRIGNISDTTILQAAILHDTLEDTKTTLQELTTLFGKKVTSLVKELTEDKSLPRKERKRLEFKNAAALSTRAKLIKIADKACNIKDITKDQPVDWPLARKLSYIEHANKVVGACRGCSRPLEKFFDDAFTTQGDIFARLR